MNKLLFALCVSCFSIAHSQNLNFTDTKLKTLLLSSNSSNQIAKDLNGNYFAIDTNSDGEIQTLEAQQVKILNIKLNGTPTFNNLPDQITDALLFTNMEELYVNTTKSAVINFVNNSKIKKVLYTGTGAFTDNSGTAQNVPIDFSFDNCSMVQDINALAANLSSGPYYPVPSSKLRFKNCLLINGDIVITGKAIEELYIENSNVTSLHLNSCYQFKKLYVPNLTSLTTITLDGSINSSTTQYFNQDVDLTASNCINLQEIITDSDHYYETGLYIKSINVNGCTNLKKIKGLNTPSINFSTAGLINLEELDASFYNRYVYSTTSGIYFGSLTSLNLAGLPKLKILKAFNQPITNSVNFGSVPTLENIDITNSCGYMNTVDVSNLSNLHTLKSGRINTSGTAGNADLQKIIAKNCISLVNLSIGYNYDLKELNLENCPLIQSLTIGAYPYTENMFTNLNSLNLKQCIGLKDLNVSYTKLTSLDISQCPALQSLSLENNSLLSNVNSSNNGQLETVYLGSCPAITNLDFSSCSILENYTLLNMAGLINSNIKNGSLENVYFENYNSDLSMCVDQAQLADLQSAYSDITFTTNCGSFLASEDSKIRKNEIQIAPNPVKDFVMLKSEENIKNVKIFNAQGRMIFSQDCNHELMRIDLSAHPAGNYIVKIKTDKTEISKKIIKE